MGRSSEDAAIDAGVSSAVGVRWFRQAGGMAPSHLSPSARPLSGRYLSFAEREDIALLHARGQGVRAIALQLGRAPCTISRELRRNAATGAGTIDYRASTAQWHADRAGRRPKPAKLAIDVICLLLSGPKSMLFWIMKEIGNAIEEAQAGGDYWQAT